MRNTGRALHHLLMLRLRDSSSLPAIDDWIARGHSELLPPAPIAVSVSALLSGEAVTRRVVLQPSLYLALFSIDTLVERLSRLGVFVTVKPTRRCGRVAQQAT